MIGVAINGLMLVIWLVIWGLGGPLLLPAICISAVGLLVCAVMAVAS